MARLITLVLVVLGFTQTSDVRADNVWTEGRDYVTLIPAQRTSVAAGKVEVMEVFSYGCIVCNNFQPTVAKLKRSLPANTQMVFLPASFNPGEDWPMLQRAYFAAQALGIAERTHQAIFDAVWKSGELAVSDQVTHRLKYPQPTIEDAARCYERIAGVNRQEFLAAANSFSVGVRMTAADDQIAAMKVSGTPCIVINGKYRVIARQDSDEFINLVKFLVNKETPPKSPTQLSKSHS
jgi:thiol:disulfide interchange protein DsbA